jgi:hypothetical protein
MNEWSNDRKINACMHKYLKGWMDERMNECMHAWMDECMDA